jgi:hypothetical protein
MALDVSAKIPTDNHEVATFATKRVHNFRFQLCRLYRPMALIRIVAAFAAIWLSSVSSVLGDAEGGRHVEVRVV